MPYATYTSPGFRLHLVNTLTERQREVVRLYSDGHRQFEIARLIGTSSNNVRRIEANAMHRLRVLDKGELIAKARRLGLV